MFVDAFDWYGRKRILLRNCKYHVMIKLIRLAGGGGCIGGDHDNQLGCGR